MGEHIEALDQRVIAMDGELAVECAPAGGQFRRFELTLPVGLLEDGSHDEASVAQRRVQAAGC
jgi:hypothetical protein